MNDFISQKRRLWLPLLSGALFLLLPVFMAAQTPVIQSAEVNFRHPVLAESFAAFEVYQLDYQQLHGLAQAASRTNVVLTFGEQHSWDIQLDAHDIRSPHYREVAGTVDGPLVLPRRPNITYRGMADGNRSQVRFSITPEWCLGMIDGGGATYFIEPLQRMIDDVPDDYYIVYEANDVLADPEAHCAYNAVKTHAPPPRDPEGQARMSCMEAEVATAGDFGMFTRYGSVQAVNDFIITVTNNMEPLYDDFNLDYLIVDQFVPTSAMADPWTNSDEAFTILDDFGPWATANMLTHDVGQIWVTRDIQGCGSGPGNFTLIGCARKIGDACGAQRYNICEDFSNSANCLRALSAHEFGHTWDGVHGEANNTTIMWGNIVCGATTWTANNITRIQNHIDSRDCLSPCGTDCTIDVGAVSQDQTCPGVSDASISALIAGANNPVTYILSGPVNAANNTGMFTNLPPGNYTLRAVDGQFNQTCFDEVNVTLDPGVDNTKPTINCPPSFSVNNDPGLCGALVNIPVAVANDNCSVSSLKARVRPVNAFNQPIGPWSSFQNDPSGFYAVGRYRVQWRAKDPSNNKRFCSFFFNVIDNEPPVAVCKDATIDFNGEEEIPMTPALVWNAIASSDNCGPVFFVEADPPAIPCDDLGEVIPVTVTIKDLYDNKDDCIAMVTVDGLPCGWFTVPGMVDCDGDADYDVPSETFFLTSEDCHNMSTDDTDEYGFVQTELCGNSEIIAQVTSVTGNALGWAGVMMRESNDPGSKMVSLMTSLSTTHRVEVRYTDDGIVQLFGSPSYGRHWLRITRFGNQFRCYSSFNGIFWSLKTAVTVPMDHCLQVGLNVNSFVGSGDQAATFNNVEVTDENSPFQANLDQLEDTRPADRSVSVFPNPTTGALSVNLSAFPDQEVDLEIVDITGQTVQAIRRGLAGSTTEHLDLSGLPAGMYFLRLRLADGTEHIEKVVLQARP